MPVLHFDLVIILAVMYRDNYFLEGTHVQSRCFEFELASWCHDPREQNILMFELIKQKHRLLFRDIGRKVQEFSKL